MKKPLFLIVTLLCLGIGTTVKAQFTDLFNFDSATGANPQGVLTYASGVLYGTTAIGGANNIGCLFSMDTNGSNYVKLLDFNSMNGACPQGSLLISGNKLYGMTDSGGAHHLGCIFSINTNGTGYKKLLDFNDTNGANPHIGSLIRIGKTLFGMTQNGGVPHGFGNIFSIDTNGSNYRDLRDFSGLDGMFPWGSFTPSVTGDTLFGMTASGGTNYQGNVFSIDTNGSGYQDIFDFNGRNGGFSTGNLTLVGSTLYGMTVDGGVGPYYWYGVLFSVHTNGSGFRDLLVFSGFPCYGSSTTSLVYSSGLLYGMSGLGGVDNLGCIFSIDTNGSGYTDLFDFSSYTATGYWPVSGLTLSGNVFYGMDLGGTYASYGIENGTIFGFRDTTNLFVTASITNISCNKDGNGSVTANATGENRPYTYLWSPGGETTATISNLSPGNYSVTVTDHAGNIAKQSVTISQPTALQAVTYSGPAIAAVKASGGTTPYTYLWLPGGATADSLTGLPAGTYTCTITDKNGCSESVTVHVTTTGTEDIAANSAGINVYPNPSKGLFTIAIGSSVVIHQSTIEVYNMLGEKVLTETLAPQTHGSLNIVDMGSQPSGVYAYRVITQDGSLAGEGKMVIQK